MRDENRSPNSLEPTSEYVFELVPRLMRIIALEGQGSGTDSPLTPPQIRALGMLAARSCTPSEIARELSVAPATISELTDLLVRKGFVVRSDEPCDRRRTVLSLTPLGEERYRDGRNRAIRAISGILGQLPAEHLPQIEQHMRALLHIVRTAPSTRTQDAE